jgi:Domain of unknown function (DUF5134)
MPDAPGRGGYQPSRRPGADVAGPAWLSASLASLMLFIAASSAGRLTIWRLRGRQTEPDTDGLHVLMGVAMAGMLEPRLSPVPYTAWLAVFAAGAAWFTWQAVRTRTRSQARGRTSGHRAPHAVECAAMIYMLLPGRPASHGPAMAMPGMSGPAAANPAVALILALFMLGYILWTADQLATLSRARAAVALNRRPAATSDQHASAVPVPGQAASFANPGAVLAPRLAACHKIVMSIAMGYMLITML